MREPLSADKCALSPTITMDSPAENFHPVPSSRLPALFESYTRANTIGIRPLGTRSRRKNVRFPAPTLTKFTCTPLNMDCGLVKYTLARARDDNSETSSTYGLNSGLPLGVWIASP